MSILIKTSVLILFLSIVTVYPKSKNQTMWSENTNMLMKIKGQYILNLCVSSEI